MSQPDFRRDAGIAIRRLRLPSSYPGADHFNFLVGVSACVVSRGEREMTQELLQHAHRLSTSLSSHLRIPFSGLISDLCKLLIVARRYAEDPTSCELFESWQP